MKIDKEEKRSFKRLFISILVIAMLVTMTPVGNIGTIVTRAEETDTELESSLQKTEILSNAEIILIEDLTAEELKSKFPDDYKILEKNGKKFRDRTKKKPVIKNGSIYDLVVEKEAKNEKTSK